MALAKIMYAIPTWTTHRAARRRARRAAEPRSAASTSVPSEWACYRFAKKLRANRHAAGRLHRQRDRRAAPTRTPGLWAETSPSTLPTSPPTRTASVPLQERARARAVHRPRRTLGAPLRSLDAQGRRLLRLQAPRRRLHARPGLPVAWTRRDARGQRVEVRARADRRRAARAGSRSQTCALDKGYDNGRVYDGCVERDCLPDHPAARDAGRQARRAQAAVLRARRVDVRRDRLQAEGHQVALPDRRVQAGVDVDQGRPAAPADPARDERCASSTAAARAVEREFGRLKHEWALLPLRVRGIERCSFTPT